MTICTEGRKSLLGEIGNDRVRLSDAGEMVESVWVDIPKHYSAVKIDSFVAMPNHIHGIIILGVGAGPVPARIKNKDWGNHRGLPLRSHCLMWSGDLNR